MARYLVGYLRLFECVHQLIDNRMMPEDSVYGPWPKSGEIDLIEARGNDAETYSLGNNIVASTMHWGTTYLNDAYLKSTSNWGAQRTKYSDGFHTYGLEWTEDYLFTWLDGRLRVRINIEWLWSNGG